MASYHIRKYRDSDHKSVVDLFSRGMEEHIPTTFWYMLMLPRTLLLFFGVTLILLLASGSWILVLLSSLILFVSLWLLAKYTWEKYKVFCLHTDIADIPTTYLSSRDSCFWVADSRGEIVGMVSALPVEDPLLQKKQLRLQHLSVSLAHRREGIGKAMVRTVLQFAQARGFSEVVLSTSILQYAALALYQNMGFQKTGESFYTIISRLRKSPLINFKYCLTSAQEGGL
ncbi:N-acetyltransferase family 8 member 7 [Cricetulus griseus]|uniref:N-acetyltransferase family 8 member 7 n=1 Tax=Cricetulus griseus TaxID=10029 RepID=G3HYC0_CRIGR|nr:N-acetyltransferase family 8 member 7 [Cricetulus griseus]XP_027284566.1 N-acetyltransferase family 8 member 7 [Cricetulus griseus]XP_027284567.1 N-acetyltransferase family 8 member 7 [Cricetulus griseus]XP_027284568.1 N-acetyltransferase family 8 member 7 [Cricetulus griseus]EGW02932.1 putative N-acetyltransferase CML3 [Cricetulus griseus]ERE66314.1 putative N-acetyltransferase CML3-like protein [Cricetulus griseus]